MYTYLWTGPPFVHYTLGKKLYSETADPTSVYSLHEQGRGNKVSSVPIRYK